MNWIWKWKWNFCLNSTRLNSTRLETNEPGQAGRNKNNSCEHRGVTWQKRLEATIKGTQLDPVATTIYIYRLTFIYLWACIYNIYRYPSGSYSELPLSSLPECKKFDSWIRECPKAALKVFFDCPMDISWELCHKVEKQFTVNNEWI